MPKLISVEEAFAILLREAGEGDLVSVELAEVLGHALAEDVRADRDFPPFDQARMDGFAVRAEDIGDAAQELAVIEYVPAGKMPSKAVARAQAVRIMTGAPVPVGADVVAPIEITASPAPERVRVLKALPPETHIARKGSDVKQGGLLLAVGSRIGPAEAGVLAAVGKAKVPIRRKPRVVVLGSGDEVVEPNATPAAMQIRNSNSYQLLAQAQSHGLEAEYLGIAPDDPHATRRMVERGLDADVLVTTGGVSAGDKDHLAGAFKDLGVEIFFDRVNVKPGKPTTFGRRGKTLVFGLPGNPVAALVCFHLFAMTAIRKRMGASDPLPRNFPLTLKGHAKAAGDRPTFRPVKLIVEQGATFVQALRWHGSGDLAGCSGADGFVLQPADAALDDGAVVSFYPLPAVL
ncbi:MAG: molybdopterin molybdotransferase MoeA [Planctomycetes bacterium]|nr:molybdopterin molybdotransferase MoeA [Planctomycetota bacterium]